MLIINPVKLTLSRKILQILLLPVFLLSPWVVYDRWDLIKKRGYLIIGTRTSLLSSFEVTGKNIGFEHQVLNQFAMNYGLTLHTETYQNNGEMFRDLELGRLDMIGGHLTITEKRLKSHLFSAPISQTGITLVTHFDHRNLASLSAFESLAGAVPADSSYVEWVISNPTFNPKNLTSDRQTTLFDLIRQVNQKTIDYTLGDSAIIDIYKHFIPGLYEPLAFEQTNDTAFMFSTNRNTKLIKQLDEFLESEVNRSLFQQFKQQLLAQIPQIDTANTVTFFDKLQVVWPQLEPLFVEVASETEFDLSLLAAISYQESHWNPQAISITGVKGLMMLTAATAAEMGLTDRTEPKQSLLGGIRYFRKMKNKLPDRIQEPNRTLFALAAYNVGFGHLEDARILAQRAGNDPDLWEAVAPFLSALNNPAMANQLKYGNADGKTAQIYVQNIMTYQQLMVWKQQKEGNNGRKKPK